MFVVTNVHRHCWSASSTSPSSTTFENLFELLVGSLLDFFLIAMPIRIVGVTFAVVLLLFCACTAAVCGALRLVYIFLLNGHNCKNL